ncbi:AMP-binding protein [Stappia sp. F7233]|uniref:AMP-binding protein n=1 Tax=Stappia albiluteola TaxID=2758565 RepID=A0A839AE59_9HYPH|nr:AMP-binding protein [Stappia albiluteola]MBA5777425.1 AMP-binding protein [Stappia albiluteola]
MTWVGAPLFEKARRTPDETGLVSGSLQLSWNQLALAVEQGASRLADTTQPGDKVALFIGEPAELMMAMLACARAARVAMICDAGWPEKKRRAVIEGTNPTLVVEEQLRRDPGPSDLPVPKPDDPFYIGFTSGSTGVPKAFRRSHGSWLASFAVSEGHFGLNASDRVLIPGGLTHSLHLYGAIQALHMGAAAIVSRLFLPAAILAQMTEEKANVLYATPTQLQLLSLAANRVGRPVPDIAQILVSGAKWHEENRRAVANAFPNARLHEFYGTSETSFIAAHETGDDCPAGSVGRALPGIDIEIRGDNGRILPAGETGLIYVRSGQLFDGYEMGGDGETRWQDGWLTVGDCGHVDEDGFLFLAGRRKRMFVSAGVNVFAEEIETILESDPNVSAAAAFGFSDPLRGTRIVAAVKAEAPADAGTLRALCLRDLEPVKVPRRFHFVEDWPLTAGGKTDLQRLEQMIRMREDAE